MHVNQLFLWSMLTAQVIAIDNFVNAIIDPTGKTDYPESLIRFSNENKVLYINAINLCSECKTWLARPALFTRSMPHVKITFPSLNFSIFNFHPHPFTYSDLHSCHSKFRIHSLSLNLWIIVLMLSFWVNIIIMRIDAFSYSSLVQVDLLDKSALKSVFSSHPEVIIEKICGCYSLQEVLLIGVF